ncbi:MAG: citrate lyase holo-[acyl-carrier protein] synthase [Deferribacteraceae bacterium]|jgi:holo-ACP synthase/triphosphoribosyl-dephospho-CoA synthase|nr:citrate lyase holo-[acyl-carrier protein] synthase [Deferribacteraceae bacterium]
MNIIHISLEQMLAAREERVIRQNKLSEKFSLPLLSFTLNIIGDVKRFTEADSCFYEGKNAIEALFKRKKITVVEKELINENTGLELLYAIQADATQLKSLLTELEDRHPLGRLFDMDVINVDGNKLSRVDLGLSERSCLVCGNIGAGCARSRAHSVEEVLVRTKTMINEHNAEIASKQAMRALLYEVSISPKPGLVDRHNSGAHTDMDFFTFIDAATELGSYFRDITKIGAATRTTPLAELLPLLRARGIQADEEMFAATGGVNTHKGLIFSLGIICAVIGRRGLFCTTTDDILADAGQVAAQALGDLKNTNVQTHGELVFAKHGMAGVRAEAAKGFPSVRDIGLPLLVYLCEEHGFSINDGGVMVLLKLMSKVADTNIVSRSSPEKLAEIQKRANDIFKSSIVNRDELIKQATQLDEELIKENISPGGCADLLAITYFMYFILEFTEL